MYKEIHDEEKEAFEKLLCPIRYILEIFGGKWKMPIVCMLAGGVPVRYSTIKRRLTGVTNMMLAQSLKELEAAGIVHREQYNEVPPRVEYSLTKTGSSIRPIFIQVAIWATEHMQAETACGSFCNKCHSIT
jgi:DNA-binding HxlR family transcriptional regulator